MKKAFLLFSISLFCILTACNQGTEDANTTQDSMQVNIATKNDSGEAAPDTVSNPATTGDQWAVAGITNPSAFKQFFTGFKSWVASNKIDSIAAHIEFPLKNCANAETFKKDYNHLFNDLVKSAVSKQDTEHFFINQNGVMTGNGELWFNEMKGNYVITAINNKPLN